MWETVKIKVESLTPEAFAPFRHVIGSFDERQPEVAIGGLATNDYEVRAAQGNDADGGKTSLTDWSRVWSSNSIWRISISQRRSCAGWKIQEARVRQGEGREKSRLSEDTRDNEPVDTLRR